MYQPLQFLDKTSVAAISLNVGHSKFAIFTNRKNNSEITLNYSTIYCGSFTSTSETGNSIQNSEAMIAAAIIMVELTFVEPRSNSPL
jgi:hypothetical protein